MSARPITILTGYLGSGKTTLLQALLTNSEGLRVAVLVNEFGSVSIDTQLVAKYTETYQSEMMELSNGCVCCTSNSDLKISIAKLLADPSNIDHVVLELSGVSDPESVVSTLQLPDLQPFCWLAGVVTVVDAESFTADCYGSFAARNQLLHADLIVLNKVDLVSSQQLVDVHIQVEQATRKDDKRGKRVIRTYKDRHHSLCKALMDVHHNPQPTDSHESDKSSSMLPMHGNHTLDESSSACQHPIGHLDADQLGSFAFTGMKPFNAARFQEFMRRQLPGNLVRMKGFVRLQGAERTRYQVQMSGRRRFHFEEVHDDGADAMQLVFIGQHLDRAAIEDQLRYCSEGALPDVGSFDESTARDKMALLRAWLTADARFLEVPGDDLVPATVFLCHLIGSDSFQISGNRLTAALVSLINQAGHVFATHIMCHDQCVLRYDAADPLPIDVVWREIRKGADELLAKVFLDSFCCGVP
mmetsp:Transcript_16148/g.31027  ORF Transcript_16148/g.31027 Transcript_16148/m.31027 type:complete len:471 (+) Transcript_16148:376-1788(+)|eukprot:CAMPEP_0114231090 /NCGR_PEP_ID=MMETSP0058-20121206/3836_1 /TAXON_ID=36894 /ORGANISM="Pyramimonas parkeae, CCMP726" /LENGTH=470 /DNA_ID=CAMNT_0001342371 /DNA_START=286 /DNA_END=1698 /DNA_ORIENTATION=-